MQTTLTKKQTNTYRKDLDNGEIIIATVCYDDECGNGYNSFAITGEIYRPEVIRGESTKKHEKTGRTCWLHSCGCVHDEIAQHFPELAPLIKWHLCSSDGPMHYIDNTVYLAGDKDHNGRAKGEPTAFSHAVRFGNSPITHQIKRSFCKFLKSRMGTGEFQIQSISHKPGDYHFADKYTFVGFGEQWHECPFDTVREAKEWKTALETLPVEFLEVPTDFSDGKARQIDAARNAAIWPEATDDDLTAPGLKERLEQRLPALLEEFRTAVESLGFVF